VSTSNDYRATIRAWAAEHHLPDASVERWLNFGEADAMAILAAARDLRLRTGQFLSALEMLADIALRDRVGAQAVLARSELRAIMSGAGSRPERASAFIDKLRELRFPRLARTRDRLEAAIAAMRLPHGLTVVLPKDLGSDEVVIRLAMRSPAEVETLLGALAAHKGEIKRLLEMLGGSYEI
jgi:hypothetical protein